MSSSETQQFQPRTCPNCQQSNAAFALRCVHCGVTLPAPNDNPIIMAEVLSARLRSIAERVQAAYASALDVGSLVLYMPADEAAIVLNKAETVVLGRLGGNRTLYDLTPHSAYTLGVSRRHAVVHHAEQGYTITDLGSANGTWVNSHRLGPNMPHAITNRDQFWLGQLILLAYVKSSDV